MDDDEAIRRNFSCGLEDLGYSVEVAFDGREGLKLFERAPFDLVLVDLFMPVMSGMELIVAMKAIDPAVPIIVVSGSGTLHDAIEAIRLGAWDYVVKPVEKTEELEFVLRRNLDRSRLLVENRRQKSQLEALLAENTDKLRESEERLRVLSDNLPDSMVFQLMREPDGGMCFLHLSAGLHRLNGLSAEAVCLHADLFLNQILPEDRLKFLTARDKSVASPGVFDVTVRMRRADGVIRWMNLCAASRKISAGRIIWDGIETDITERVETEDQLRQAQKLEALGTLAGGIAHDFNNILCAILTLTEQTKLDNPHNSDLQENLQEVLKAGHRASNLVSQIISFSRRHQHERTITQLSPVIEEVLRLLRATLPATIEIRRHIASNLPPVLADPNQIHQVLMNLCANAAHAMEGTHGQLAVRLDSIQLGQFDHKPSPELTEGNYLRLVVTDTGHGMSAGTMERIFEPFFTTKAVGSGTGLGLSVVHGIVTEHKGSITVETSPGKGTTFRIYLPALSSVENSPDEANVEIQTGNGQRVMVVDDEPTLCAVIKKLVARLGYSPIVFNSSLEALEAIQQSPECCDVLITDLTMPVMTGIELATRVLKIRPELSVILTSGYTGSLSQEQARQKGIRDVLHKPMSYRTLALALNRAFLPPPAV